MRILILLTSILFFSCTNQLKRNFVYKPDREALIEELKIKENSSVPEIEKALQNYFQRFDQRLRLTLNETALKVDGPEEAIKIFEYVYLTMFENNPRVFCEIDYKSSLNKLSLIKNLELNPYSGTEITDEKSGLEMIISYRDKLNFTDFVNLEFSIFQMYEEKSHKLSFNCPFKNGEEEKFLFVVDDYFEDLKLKVSGSVKISWHYENSYFYKSLTNFISKGDDREIAVMTMVTGENLEEVIRSNSDQQDRNKPIEQIFEKYLGDFGIKLNEDDLLIYNKKTYNILLMSSRKNCQRFKEIMAPLCISFTKKASLEGDVQLRGKSVTSFQIPVTFNSSSRFVSSFEKETEKESYIHEDFSIFFQYNDDLYEDKAFLETEIKYEYLDEKVDSSIDASTMLKFIPVKEQIIDFKNGMSLKVMLNSYLVYE